MSQQLLKRLDGLRKKRGLSTLALCRLMDVHNVTYYRWKKAKKITGPYKKIIEEFLARNVDSPPRTSSGQPQTSELVNRPQSSDIAVVGIACRYPGAKSIKELWENILSQRVQFRRMLDARLPLAEYSSPDPKSSEMTYATKAALIDGFVFDWAKHRIPKKTFESTDIVHWLALDTALRALEDAGYRPENVPTKNTGVIVGNTLTGEQTRSQTLPLRWPYVRKTLDATLAALGLGTAERQNVATVMEGVYKSAFFPPTEDSLAGGLANTIAGRVCNYLDFKGGGYIVDGACSSSLLAVATAANALKIGDLDIALAGGVDVSLDPFELVGFARAGALAKDKMRVYDRNASGFIPGEGCGFVVLKRLEDALRDKNYIYAVIKGWGISSDGKGGIMEPSAAGQALAIERAYRQVEYSPSEIQFVEGHGTGTTKGDRVELEGIAKAVSKKGEKLSRDFGVTSFKSIVGHTKAAAGVGGFIKAVLAVNQRVLPPTANCREANEVFSGSAQALYPLRQGVLLDKEKTVRGGVSAAGFGGINCHIAVASRGEPKKELSPEVGERALLVSHQETEVFVFGSATAGVLRNLIRKFKEDLRFISQAEMTDLAARLSKNLKKRLPVKIAIVTDSPENLYRALCAAEEELGQDIPDGTIKRIDSLGPHTRILLSKNARNPRIGFLFPGQASQKLNMTRVLFERFEWARELAGVTKKTIAEFIYIPDDKLLTPEDRAEAETALAGTEITQPAVAYSSLLWSEFLLMLGITPSAVGGHSLGEVAAFYRAGAFDKEIFLRFAEFRGQAMSGASGSAGMVSLFCSLSKAQELLERAGGKLVIANINSPAQIIISGARNDINLVMKEAKKEDVAAYLLPVSNAFHSPFMDKAGEKIKRCRLLAGSYKNSGIGLYSARDGGLIDGKVALNEYFAAQVTSPVDFTKLAGSLSGACDLLIEVGPGRVLSDLVRAINKDKGPECLPVEGAPGTDRDLNCVLAECFVRGVSLNWAELYKNRLVRPFIPPSRRKFIINQCERPLKVPSGLTQKDSGFVMKSPAIVPPATAVAAEPAVAAEIVVDGSDKVAQILIRLVEQLTGFNKESIQLNLRLLDDLNLDSIKAAELIAEATKFLGLAGQIDPAQYSNKTLDEIRQKLEALVVEKNESKPHQATQQDILKRYAKDVWVRNFIQKFEAEPLIEKDSSVLNSIKNVLIVSDLPSREVARRLKDDFKKLKMSILTVDDINVGRKPDCMVALLSVDANNGLTSEKLHGMMERLHEVIALAANAKHVIFAQLGTGDFNNGRIRALASTLHLERPDLRLRVIDFNQALKGSFIADKILDELQVTTDFTIAGYTSKGVRQVPVFEVSNPASYKGRNILWSKKDVVFVTGGAKGITAECALEFARLTKAQMVLVGRSAKDTEIEKTLERFRKEKFACDYRQCDVTDFEQVRDVVEDIQKCFGPVTSVIHGAGLNSLKRLSQANLEDVYKESLPKVMGAVNILETLSDQPLKLFVAMASIIGLTGMEGSGWYGFANEILVKYLRSFKSEHKETEIIAPAFSVWDEVGMGIKLGSIEKLAEKGIGSIPVTEGVKRFKELIEKDAGDEQVIITARVAGLDTLRLKEFKPAQKWRFIEDIKYYLPGVELISRVHLNTKDDSYVLDHNWKGSLLFPLVFGLEAMAEAAGFVTGTREIKSLRFKDIRLDRPVSVSQDNGTNIEIHAVILQPLYPQDTPKVKIEIYCEHTNYKEPHFSAILEINQHDRTTEPKVILKEELNSHIDLDVHTDVYGPILFQGKMFHRIDEIHELFYNATKENGRCLFTSTRNKSSNDFLKINLRYGNQFLIGDPFFIDSLLQSMQLIITQEACLPNYIEEIELGYLDRVQSNGVFIVKSELQKISDQFLNGNAQAFYQGKAITRIKNCSLKIIDHVLTNPSANDLVNPISRDQRIIEEKLAVIGKALDIKIPLLKCFHDRALLDANKSVRHQIELPLISETISEFLKLQGVKAKVKNLEINWQKSGRPVLSNRDLENIRISLSHNQSLLICVVGYDEEACDIESLKEHTREDWLAILGKKEFVLLEKMINVGLDLNFSGTSIWSASETLRKALNQSSMELKILDYTNDLAIFEYDQTNINIKIISTLLKLTKGTPKIISFATTQDVKKKTSQHPKEGSIAKPVLKKFGFDENRLFGVNLDYSGPHGQVVFTQRFPITFKSNQSLGKRVYFTNFFDWMGSVRENSIYPIMPKLLNDIKTGEWGMVTNSVQLEILGELKGNDTVESKVWLENIKGNKGGTFDLCFEWKRELAANHFELAALGKQRVTWVKIVGRGETHSENIPGYIKEFMDSRKPQTKLDQSAASPIGTLTRLRMGRKLLSIENGLGANILLSQETFRTTLEDSNLVGNIYFSNYAKWLGRSIDFYFYDLIPEFYKKMNSREELICLTCDIDYLGEAMPFDKVLVKMYLDKVYECGFDLHFEFYCLENKKIGQKLAYAKYKGVWVRYADENEINSIEMPEKILSALTKYNFTRT